MIQKLFHSIRLPLSIFSATANQMASSWPIRGYEPKYNSFPYTPLDLRPLDPSSDTSFYQSPRFVTHIDDNAISVLTDYYSHVLPRNGRILDFCSSWISHYPRDIEEATKRGEIEVLGLGMNREELRANALFGSEEDRWDTIDLNDNPEIRIPGNRMDLNAATCTVSIDYLTRPVETLTSLRNLMKSGSSVHLAISNRCFATKVVGRWLRISEAERLEMVGDYLWFSGWRNVEIITLSKGTDGMDPLWVVRAVAEKESSQ